MDINAYIKPLLKWWRLLVIATAIAIISSSISTLFQPDRYYSRTTLAIGRTILDPNPESGQIYLSQQLAGIYADMANREPIQVATMEALGIDWLPAYQARVVPNTMLIEIAVTDTNPQRAQIIADEIANQLILRAPTTSDTETGQRQEFIQNQLSGLQIQIQDTEKEIEELQKKLITLNSASQIANTEKQINELTQKLLGLRESYASFLSNSQEGAVNILSVVEPANLPTQPIGANKLLIVMLAAVVGLVLGVGAAYLIEFLDRTIKTASDIDRIFGLPVIGYISEIPEDETRATFVANNPDSLLAENFRMLRSNIEFFSIRNPIKTILITSPTQGNGKTTVASNLALSLSQIEQDVILVDADLRRSTVHSSLKMTKEPGLADVINNKADIHSVVRRWKNEENLKVVTAGNKPPNITEVVGSKRIAMILSELKENHELIIIDAPPLIISDTYNLASTVDGVIIVMEPGQTNDDQARAIKEQLNRANAKVLGFVFNKMSEERVRSYGDFQYQSLYSSKYYGDYNKKVTKGPSTDSRSNKLVDFFEHGKVPPELATEVQNAIIAIKTQPRNMLNRIRKSKTKVKTSEEVRESWREINQENMQKNESERKRKKTSQEMSERADAKANKRVSRKTNKNTSEAISEKANTRTSRKTSEKTIDKS